LITAAARRDLEAALGDSIAFDVPMTRHTSLRIGGPADALATPRSREQISTLLAICGQHRVGYWTIGAGFNCLVSDDGVDGVVVKLTGLRALSLHSEGSVFAEAGVTHASLTRFCVERGLAGLEFGAGIPGVVGGWIPMNAGIGTREVKDVVQSIEVVEPGAGERTLSRADLDFRYRALCGLAPGTVIVSARFAVTASSSETVRAEVDRLLAQRAESQPLNVPSCGSVFKNPEGDFAGRLIEAAGLKGARVGGAEISPVHANFIANRGGATAGDVLQLMQRAQTAVEEAAGVRLEPEVRLVGRTRSAEEGKS